MKSFLKNAVLRLLLVLMAILFSLVLLEVMMRMAGPKTMDDLVKTWDRNRQSFYGTRPNPWVQGARNNVLRVAVVGDSFANGQGVQSDDTFGVRLERLLNLNEGVRPAEVRIWAKGGMGTYEEAVFLDDAMAWKPRVLILQFFLNDTEDNRRRGELKEWKQEMMPRVPPPRLARLLKKTRVGEWLYLKLENIHSTRGFIHYYQRLYDPAYTGWQKFLDAIQEFRKSCTESGTELVVVIFPIISHVDRYPFDDIHRQIHQALEKENVRYLDLLDDFRGKMPVRLEVVPKLDSHPNEIAHRMASEMIFNYLLENKLIEDAFKPQSKTAGRYGYWTRMAESMLDPLAGAVEPEE